MHPIKEVRFFGGQCEKGITWYEDQFAEGTGRTVISEASPQYTFAHISRTAAEQMADHIPNAKLIYIVRHPITRIESQYCQALDNAEDIGAFNEVVLSDPRFLESSAYQDRLDEYLEFFDADQIHVMFLDDLQSNPDSTLSQLGEFVGLPDLAEFDSNARLNNRDEKRIYRPVFKRVGLHRLVRKHGNHLPRAFVDIARRVVKQRLPREVRWEPSVREEVVQRLRAKTEQFLANQGRPTDMWAF